MKLVRIFRIALKIISVIVLIGFSGAAFWPHAAFDFQWNCFNKRVVRVARLDNSQAHRFLFEFGFCIYWSYYNDDYANNVICRAEKDWRAISNGYVYGGRKLDLWFYFPWANKPDYK